MFNALSEKPRKNLIAAAIDGTCVYIPMHGEDATTGTIASITKGNPTKLELVADTGAWLVGSYIYIADADTQMTGLVDGAYKVVKTDNVKDVWIDFDSSDETDWASGGTIKIYYFTDVFGNVAPQVIQGTTTTVFSENDGVLAHLAGSYSNLVTTGLDAFDINGFRGRLLIGASNTFATGGFDGVFAIGRLAANGGATDTGTITLAFNTVQMVLTYRPATGVIADNINTSVFSGVVGAGKEFHAFILDFSNYPTGVEIYAINNGVLSSSVSADMDGSTGLVPPIAELDHTNGVCFGATQGGSYVPENYAGTGSTTFKYGDFVWWKTTKSVADCIKVANDMANNFELSPHMV